MAWKDAEDMGFMWTSDAPEFGPTRVAAIHAEYAATLARLRAAAGGY